MNTTNPFAAFNPFAAKTAGTPFGGSSPFDMGAMQDAMKSFMPTDFFKTWQTNMQNAAQSMMSGKMPGMGAATDGLNNPSGPFGMVSETASTGAAKLNGLGQTVDWTALAAAQKKNTESMTAANQAAMTGLQQILRHQAEMFRETMQTAGQMMTDLMATGTPEEKLARQADIARRALDMTSAHLRQLADLTATSQRKTLEIVESRVKESLDELKQTAQASSDRHHSASMQADKADKAAQTASQAAQTTMKTATSAADSVMQAMQTLTRDVGDTLN